MIQEYLKKDLVYRIASVLLAVLLWLFVINAQNPIIEGKFTIPISYVGLKEGMVLGDKAPSTEIRFKGLHSLVNPLTSKDFKAVVDLSQAKPGEGTFQVKVELPAGVELVSLNQRSVNLNIDVIQEKQLPVRVKTINSTAQGYSSFLPVINPSQVIVRGSQQALANLEAAQVTVDLDKATTSLDLSLDVTHFIDKGGKEIPNSGLQIIPKAIQVQVPIIQNIPTKTVTIKPMLQGKPRDGWSVSRVILDPETIKITGPYEKLVNVDQILTKNIDITGLQDNLITQAALEVPEGISLLYQPSVKVVVQVEAAPVTKELIGITLTTENAPPGYRIVLSKDKIDVTVKGSPTEINNLDASGIKALVDLNSLQPGVHHLPVKIALPNNLQILKADPATVDVTISTDS